MHSLHPVFLSDAARDPEGATTYMAERATATQTDAGMRVVLFNGSRQQVDKETGRLTIFYFDQYSLDIGLFSEQGGTRWQEPEERLLGRLLQPDEGADDQFYRTELIAEGHRRLSSPLFVLAYCFVAMAALLSGEFHRRGQLLRILAAIGIVIGLQLAGLSLFNLARRSLTFVPAMYSLPLVAMLASAYLLTRGSRRVSTPDGASLAARGT